MKIFLIIGAAFLVFLALVLVGNPTLAAKPNHQACIGEDISGYAEQGTLFGEFVSGLAVSMQGIGEDVQAHQAGLIPDEIIPNSCND